MPLYEYLCENCEMSFERLSSMAAADEAACPACGGSDTRRLLSVIGGLANHAGQSRQSTGGCACGGACSCN